MGKYICMLLFVDSSCFRTNIYKQLLTKLYFEFVGTFSRATKSKELFRTSKQTPHIIIFMYLELACTILDTRIYSYLLFKSCLYACSTKSTGGTKLWCKSRAAAENQEAISEHAQLTKSRPTEAAVRACSLLTAMPDMRTLRHIVSVKI